MTKEEALYEYIFSDILIEPQEVVEMKSMWLERIPLIDYFKKRNEIGLSKWKDEYVMPPSSI